MRQLGWIAWGALACGGAAAPAVSAEPTPAQIEATGPEAVEGTRLPAPPDGASSAATYPTPYTAEQIRDATRPGRAYTWRLEESGKPAVERTITFTAVDAEGAEVTSAGVARRVTWEELRQHALFPRDQVTTREETVSVPAGTYDCVVYVVADPAAGEVSTFYFAKALPGAPVLFFTEQSGARQMTQTLIQYAPGRGG